MARVVFHPTAGSLVVARGTSLLAAAVRAGLPLGQACRGQGVCRSCVVRILAGAERLEAPSDLEQRWRLAASDRLACQARVAIDDDDAEVVIWCPTWGSPIPP